MPTTAWVVPLHARTKKIHLVICTNSAVRTPGCYTPCFWEGALHSPWGHRSGLWPRHLAVEGGPGEPPASHRQAGSSHQKCSNDCLKIRTSLDQKRLPQFFWFWPSPPANEQESLALQHRVSEGPVECPRLLPFMNSIKRINS